MHRFNTQRKFGSAACYIYTRIDGHDVLLTEHQFTEAKLRAKVNPEDLPRLSLVQRFAYWLLRN